MAKSRIEWTDATWNPVTGCTPISAGCVHCYAARLAKRLKAMGQPRYARGFEVTLHPEVLEEPLHWKKPRHIFICSMSDLFHPSVPASFVADVLGVMVACPQHTFQVLTKRAYRMKRQLYAVTEDADCRASGGVDYLPNLWLGVTVENADALERVEHLRRLPAAVRFLSCEPLLGPLDDLRLDDIHWVICGGETGPGARPMNLDWARAIRDQCAELGIPFFFKSVGGRRRTAGHNLLDGVAHTARPDFARSTKWR